MTPEIPSRHALLQQIDFQNPRVKYPRGGIERTDNTNNSGLIQNTLTVTCKLQSS